MSLYLFLSNTLFMLGVFGMFLCRKDIMMILISLELILLSVNMNFVFFSMYMDDLLGQIYALLVLTVAAAETAMGLAMTIVYYRLRGGMSMDLLRLLKG